MPDNHFTFSAPALAALTCFTARGGPRKYLRAVRFEPAPGGGTIGIACDGAVLAVWRDVRSEGPDRAVMRIFPRCGIRRMAQRLAGCVRIDADGPGFEVGHDGHCGFRAFHHGEADTMANSIHPDWRRMLPSEVALSRHGRRHPVFLSEQLRCFIRAAEIMEAWGAWRILAPEEPEGPHPVLASRDPEFLGLLLPSPGKPGGFVPAPFETPDWVRHAA